MQRLQILMWFTYFCRKYLVLLEKYKVSAVSYLNTKPYIYGIENHSVLNKIQLSLDMPSICAEKIITNQVDVALIPVGALNKLSSYYRISDFGIGCDGKVDSVAMYSDVPLQDITTIYLDYQSRTSVVLLHILASNHWNITPNWVNASPGFEEKIKSDTAGLIIGDRTFFFKNKFKYKFDLGEEWKKMTGLPFIFAIWVSSRKLPKEFLQEFNNALNFGIENIRDIIPKLIPSQFNHIDISSYYKNNISFNLTPAHLDGMELFFSIQQ